MDPEVAKYMRTERKPGSLDVHPHYDAIILNYEVNVQILGPNDNPLHGEKKTLKKTIELPMINSRTDPHSVAREVVNQCDLIHHSRIPEVEQIIYYLKKRKLHGSARGDFEKNGDINNAAEANYNNLADYIDLLYEGMAEKVKGAHLIQILARDPENLEALSKNETLISALGRVLREDWKRSIALSSHLVFTFFCFSMYSTFHHIILKCKVGSICMDIIDFELRRYDKWKAELEGAQPPSDVPIVKKSCPSSASMSEIPRSRIPEPVRPKSGHFGDLNIKAAAEVKTPENNKQLDGSVYDELTTSMESLEDKRLTPEQKLKRFRTLVKKQEHLLRVAYYLLLNIAEDENVEEKMSKRNIAGLLIKALDRNNDDLLILVVTFLKKLSIMQCNKDIMANCNLVDKLPKLLNSRSADLVHLTLKLLFNLSFDNKIRSKMIKAGLIPKVISFMGDDRHQEVVMKLLYHLSYDEDSKSHFADSIGLIVDMLLLNVGNEGDKIMIALCINLAAHPEISHQMARENRLRSLIIRAFTFEDSMLMKLIHNISNNLVVSSSFLEFVGDISKAVVESKNLDFVRECIGILSNLHLPDLDWAEVFKHFKMANWIKKIISVNSTDPELVLQVIVLLGTAAADENCSQLLCESGMAKTLIDLLKTHQEDDEIVLQIVYVFYVTLWYETNVDYLINNTDVPAYLIDLLQDNNKNIKKICNMCLNIISEHDSSWAVRIRIEKFRHHNAQWLQMVDSQQLEPEDEEEDELPPYLNTEYLSQAVVRPATAITKEMDLLEDKEFNDDYFENSHDDELDIIEDYDMEDL
ncbi:kinesin-associated protein 3 [Anthonomus grandis grandis]|uniref:kinesin-associated protein 3 n=1 Tax=Anthonomus grandis grandis TaxID=2921223 RepID=UPI002164F49F|nr:kinesin-associated protein 3 [Anthonomus grandis grandis]XP_050309551.1 kinesin-associated protein 3 [Anthonomus grandis grandis]